MFMERARYRQARVYTTGAATIQSPHPTALLNDPARLLNEALALTGSRAYAIDRIGRIVMASAAPHNPAGAESAASAQPGLIGTLLLEQIPEQHRPTVRVAYEAVLRGEQAQCVCDLEYVHPEPHVHRLTIRPLVAQDVTISGALLVCQELPPQAGAASVQGTAQHFQQHAQLLQLLNHIGAQLAAELDEEAVLHIVTEALVSRLGLAFARIWVFNPATDELVLRSSAGMYTDTDGEFARLRLGEQAVGQIAATRRALVTNDVPNTAGLGSREWALATGMRAFAGYPLVARERLYGVVAFYSQTPLDMPLTTALEPLTHQVAVALERSRLYIEQVAARQEAQTLAGVAAERAAQLAATLGAMTDGVWAVDRNGRVLTVNDAALAMFRAENRREQLVSLDQIVALFSPHCAQRNVVLGLRAALAGHSVQTDLVLEPADPEQPPLTIAVNAAPIYDAGQLIGAVTVVRDVTEQKAIERLRDDFLSLAAHELKTPVTAIKGYAQLALMRLNTNNPRLLERALRTIEQQAQRIAHLVGELVDVSRIQGGRLELRRAVFDLVALVRDVIEHRQAQTQQHRLLLEAPATLPVVADFVRIEQVVQNLVDNAVKYSPNGGTIEIVVSVADGMAQVIVRDHGIGIAPEQQTHVFDAWFQAHKDTVGDYGGMGLGLNICKEIVVRHGGRIWVDSVEGGGTIFGFALPLPSRERVER